MKGQYCFLSKDVLGFWFADKSVIRLFYSHYGLSNDVVLASCITCSMLCNMYPFGVILGLQYRPY